MLGAILGDIVGSPYEFDPIDSEEFPLFCTVSRFTDDTVMTVAVADGLMTAVQEGRSVGECVARSMRAIGRRYLDSGYGGRFIGWISEGETEEIPPPYGSWGNGSAMRTSPVAWLYGRLEDVETHAKVVAAITHDHPEGIKGAQAVASAIFLARMGDSRYRIKKHIEERYGYDLSKDFEEVRARCRFDESCQTSVPEAIMAFLASRGFEDAIRKAVSLGGDADTQAAIAGSIAEAYFGIPEELKREAKRMLSDDLLAVVERWHESIRRLRGIVDATSGDSYGYAAGGSDGVQHEDGFVGVFDSGVGGISVLREMVRILPEENFVFFGDSANAPYGDRDPAEVLALSSRIAEGFIDEGAKAIVIACNTATSVAAASLRQRYPDTPIVGIEPALRPAALHPDSRRILVMATERTIELDKFNALLNEHLGDGANVECVAWPGLVEVIEKGDVNGEETRCLLERLVGRYRGWADSVVLGCTHYPFAKDAIRDVLGDVRFFDGGEGTACQLARVLSESGLAAPSGAIGSVELRSSIDTPAELDLYGRFLSITEI